MTNLYDKKNNNILEILDKIIELSEKMNNDYIISYLEKIGEKIEIDLASIKNIYLKDISELQKNKLKIFFKKSFLISSKTFFDILDLETKNKILNQDIDEFNGNFSTFLAYNETFKNEIIFTFERFIKIVVENGNVNDLKYVYSFYQTMIIGFLSSLPKNYRNEILNQENFLDVKQEVETIKYDYDLKICSTYIFYRLIIEKEIDKFLKEKYNQSLFVENVGFTRKRI